MALNYFKLITVLILAPSWICCTQESTASEGSIKEELEAFMKDEGDAFFESKEPYYNSKRLSEEVLRIKEKILTIEDNGLQKILNYPSAFFVIHQMVGNNPDHAILKENYTRITTTILEYLFTTKMILSNYTFRKESDKKKIINIINNEQRILLKILSQMTLLNLSSDFCIPLSKKNKNIYNFIETVCRANNLTTPKVFITSDKDKELYLYLNLKDLSLQYSAILLSTALFKDNDDAAIKGVILHELGHYYYGDSERCLKYAVGLNKESKRNYNYFTEYRADLFAASYGFGPGLASFLYRVNQQNILDSSHLKDYIESPTPLFRNRSLTHPASLYRIDYLHNLPTDQSFKIFGNTVYPLTYEPSFKKYGALNPSKKSPQLKNVLGIELKQRLAGTPNITQQGKIINSSAQLAAKALQAVKRLPK